jgi:hypothetical protein
MSASGQAAGELVANDERGVTDAAAAALPYHGDLPLLPPPSIVALIAHNPAARQAQLRIHVIFSSDPAPLADQL